MDRDYLVGKVAYEEARLMNMEGTGLSWNDLSEAEQRQWVRIARKIEHATNNLFLVCMAIHVPGRHYLSGDIEARLSFGSSDEQLEEAGKAFVAKMKELRGG